VHDHLLNALAKQCMVHLVRRERGFEHCLFHYGSGQNEVHHYVRLYGLNVMELPVQGHLMLRSNKRRSRVSEQRV
jgi:hypothetical protein